MENKTNSRQANQDEQVTLRCSKCGKPITPEEAVQTPVGYRCRECVRDQQRIFDTSKPLDYVWGFLIAGVISFLGSLLTSVVGFFIFLLAPAAGVAVAEVVRAVIKKRRGKKLFRIVAAGVILGGLPLIITRLINFILALSFGSFNLFSLLPLAYQILYLILAVPSAYYRLSGSRRL